MSGDKPPLFRPESLEARRLSWLGQPAVLNNISSTVVAIVSVIMVTAIVLFLVFGQYTRRVSVSGVMLPTEGLTRIASPNTGWVTHQYVEEGDHVERGDPLYEINIDNTTALGGTQAVVNHLLETQRQELSSEIERQKALAAKQKQDLENQRANLQHELEQSDKQIKVVEGFANTLQGYAKKQAEYVSRGISVSSQYESRFQSYVDVKMDLETLKRQRIQLNSELSKLTDQLAAQDLRSASKIGELRRQLIRVEQQIAEGESHQAIRVTAPRTGVVTSVVTHIGQTASPGTPLLTILPDDAQLKAQMLVPSKDIGFLKKGDKVLLRYAAFPYQKFGQYPGQVTRISRAPLRQDEIKLLVDGGAAAPSSTAIYRITVQPDSSYAMPYGRKVPLQAGMQVEAHILVETRPLYQWILEPLYGLSETLNADGVSR